MTRTLTMASLVLFFWGCQGQPQNGSGASPQDFVDQGSMTTAANTAEERARLLGLGFKNLGEIPDTKAGLDAARNKVAGWMLKRERLAASMPSFNGSQEAYDRMLRRLGKAQAVEVTKINNRHVPGQVDELLVLRFRNMTSNVYKANLDPVKYITAHVTIRGAVGIPEVDQLFRLSKTEVLNLMGDTGLRDDNTYSLSPVNTETETRIVCAFVGDTMSRLEFQGYLD